ncbi:lytic polysaccharide monooxygenase [Lophiostoma macrostomum CBS 122681]|uniref:lytic cellulose monooxygenase (C4-dehydrogenating) n=1 Tax=Lophiostoma macrostomum CBS 122681 TaxID=1314788 RepID=A0A6A6TLR4_9PLEO|nr:lytic polysaccharide monooxygenase [Lophiostoma macrostomum CBS 122681]
MKLIFVTWGLSALHAASAHYVFNKFIANGTINKDWKYIRQVSPFVNVTKPGGPQQKPLYDLTSSNIRCGRDAMTTGNGTEIATVIAGHEIGFRLDLWFPKSDSKTLQYNFTIPAGTPAGLYLLRVESIYPRIEFNSSQFFMNCAQIEVIGSSNPVSPPGPMTRFPGAYDDTDEGKLYV